MITNALAAENAAAAELEDLLKGAGWSDGWGLEDDEVRRADKPLFYKNFTSSAAEEARIVIDGQMHNIYAVYRVFDIETVFSGNQPHHFVVRLAISIYYDDPALLVGTFSGFVEAALTSLTNSRWSVNVEGDDTTTLGSDSQPYGCRKTLFAEKAFI